MHDWNHMQNVFLFWRRDLQSFHVQFMLCIESEAGFVMGKAITTVSAEFF